MTGRRGRVLLLDREVARMIFVSWDFGLGLLAGIASFFVAFAGDAVREAGISILLGAAALGVALLAVALTALAILVGLLGEEYIQVLGRVKGSVRMALLPYQVVSAVGALSAITGALAAVAWRAQSPFGWSPKVAQSVALATTMGLATWALVGTVQLVNLTAFHGVQRANLIQGIRKARRLAAAPKPSIPPEGKSA